MKSSARTVKEYLASLQPERRAAIAKVRAVIRKNLPVGYQEGMLYGMIGYYIPLSRYPKTYNKQPLAVASLASQKNHMALYLMNIYGDKETEKWFQERYKATGKKMDAGKCCVRFRKLDELPLDLIGEAVARTPADAFISLYERARTKGGKKG